VLEPAGSWGDRRVLEWSGPLDITDGAADVTGGPGVGGSLHRAPVRFGLLRDGAEAVTATYSFLAAGANQLTYATLS
jgi:hypothetical protein